MKKVDFAGKDPRVELKRQRISEENQIERKIYTQLPDGQVPSFEKFKATKQKIE